MCIRDSLEKCIDAQLGTALTSDKDINEDMRIWPAAAGCTINCVYALDKLFLKSQPLADRRRVVFHCKQTIGQKMSQLITEKENERFAANTADMTQDDFFVIAILEMCTEPELSKRFREVKTDELTWERLRDVAETYERATAFDARAMMVNSNRRNGRKNQITQGTSTEQCYRCNRKGLTAKDCRTDKEKLYSNCVELKDTYPKPVRKKKQRATATRNLGIRTKRDR